MFYIFQGSDTFSCAEALANLKARLGDPSLADLNITYLDERSATLDELRHHCDVIPFLAEHRLVIARNLLASKDKGLLDRLAAYLPQLPPTTWLVFVESQTLPARHPVLALTGKGQPGQVQTFEPPTGQALINWIRDRVKKQGGQIAPDAANELGLYVGSDLHQQSHEIAKLVAYTGGKRPISVADVRLLTANAREADIFAMVDALSRRDGKTASQIYHQLLEAGEHPLSLMGMITRQFRLMIQVKELAPQFRQAEEIAQAMREKPYPVKKILGQIQNYTMEQLIQIYHKLLDTDMDIKTGQMDAALALDILIASTSRVGS